jgi:hypothetical protein
MKGYRRMVEKRRCLQRTARVALQASSFIFGAYAINQAEA